MEKPVRNEESAGSRPAAGPPAGRKEFSEEDLNHGRISSSTAERAAGENYDQLKEELRISRATIPNSSPLNQERGGRALPKIPVKETAWTWQAEGARCNLEMPPARS